jgi:hypothetical protein
LCGKRQTAITLTKYTKRVEFTRLKSRKKLAFPPEAFVIFLDYISSDLVLLTFKEKAMSKGINSKPKTIELLI